MQQLLENEGIEIEENKVKNFDIIFKKLTNNIN